MKELTTHDQNLFVAWMLPVYVDLECTWAPLWSVSIWQEF